jgi:two-component system chemotaxis response regulator CheY
MHTPRRDPRTVANPSLVAQRILVADDDREARGLIASLLRRDGYEVVEATDGVELLAHLVLAERAPELRRSIASALCGNDGTTHETGAGRASLAPLGPTSFAAIVADVRLPGLTGLDVLSLLGCTGCLIPVILVTTSADEQIRAEARELGAVAVLGKPLELDGLLAATRVSVRRRSAA